MTIETTSIIKEKIRSYIQKTAHIDNEKIKNDSMIFREGYFDSMGLIMLITHIEEEFGIKTNDADLIEENFESINSISDYIYRKSVQ